VKNSFNILLRLEVFKATDIPLLPLYLVKRCRMTSEMVYVLRSCGMVDVQSVAVYLTGCRLAKVTMIDRAEAS